MADMEVGQLVDFVIEYNRIHDIKSSKKGEVEPEEVIERKATQADWDALAMG